ncbi:hypothetical protein V6N11_016653 [Hibiscus sabdariffa]|uniref:BED-type domain-containing protein n=1 Tax=Hibiscus sabdariffa TaxID=183260 RepID=A0ABR2TWJ3_9ROSI
MGEGFISGLRLQESEARQMILYRTASLCLCRLVPTVINRIQTLKPSRIIRLDQPVEPSFGYLDFGSSEAYAMEVANESTAKKPKRLTSVVWNHFERVKKADICYAVCVHCNKKLSGSSNSGTTHLRNHLMRCLKRSNYDVSQLLAVKRRKKENTLTIANITYDEGQRKDDYMKPTIVKYEQDQRKDEAFNIGSGWFDPERSRLDLARMIILHGYPLAMVEHVGFKVFVKNLQPLFDVVQNSSIELSCAEIYTKEKQRIYDMLSKLQGRTNLAVEMWPRLSNGQLLDVRSAAHILNSIAQDAIEALQAVIQKIRGSFRHVKSSQPILVKFNEIAQQHGINNHKSLVLDCPIRWNSTYMMLETAVEYRNVFHHFPDLDPDLALSSEEWEWTSSITSYLKLLVEIINVFSGNKCPTANIYFPEICHVHIQLIEWCKSSDGFLCSLATKMKAKFDKYWSKCSLALAVAAILDPRFKMKLVEYYYSQIYGSTALERIKEASDGIKELFNAYSIYPTLIDQGSASPGSSLPSSSNDTRDRLKGFDKFLHETSQSQSSISDLEKYLDEPVFPRNCDFSILNWWRVHTPRYPILSMMARDVLGTPMSTIGYGHNLMMQRHRQAIMLYPFTLKQIDPASPARYMDLFLS